MHRLAMSPLLVVLGVSVLAGQGPTTSRVPYGRIAVTSQNVRRKGASWIPYLQPRRYLAVDIALSAIDKALAGLAARFPSGIDRVGHGLASPPMYRARLSK